MRCHAVCQVRLREGARGAAGSRFLLALRLIVRPATSERTQTLRLYACPATVLDTWLGLSLNPTSRLAVWFRTSSQVSSTVAGTVLNQTASRDVGFRDSPSQVSSTVAGQAYNLSVWVRSEVAGRTIGSREPRPRSAVRGDCKGQQYSSRCGAEDKGNFCQ